MSNNYRVYYPLNYIAIGPHGSASGTPVHGVQSVDMNTTFDLEQVFELGQLDVYENIENLPNVEITAERVLDGYPLMYHLATSESPSSSLVNRMNQRADVILSIFSDDNENASGTPLKQVYCSGMYIDSISYNLPVEGNATESITFVGNDKVWISDDTSWGGGSGFAFDGHFDGTDSPHDTVQRRQNIVMGNNASTSSIWPTHIPGMTVTNGNGFNEDKGGRFGVPIQDVDISVSLGREDLFELGRRVPYFKYASYPVAVECTINILAAGDDPSDGIDASSTEKNLTDEPIVIRLTDSTEFDLGDRNRLQSVSFTGGDTGGSNATISYSYQNFNILRVTQDEDPAGL